jgi:hypothetical protein
VQSNVLQRGGAEHDCLCVISEPVTTPSLVVQIADPDGMITTSDLP